MRYLLVIGFFLVTLFSCITPKKNQSDQSAQPVTDSIPWYPLETITDLDIILKEIGDARIVLLGESTHGTHEYYTWRTAITERLIKEKGFTIVSVEGDWTDSYRINKLLKGPLLNDDQITEALKGYDRWPSSMWGNYEMVPFLSWINKYNNTYTDRKVSYYGLDLYSFWEWVAELNLREAMFFSKYNNDAQLYAADIAAHYSGMKLAENLFDSVMRRYKNLPDQEDQFIIYQQAWLMREGDRFFRSMRSDRVTAINTRDRFMAETIKRILKFHGPDAKLVAWVHNGHSGDAHYSSMSSAGYTSTAEVLKNDVGDQNIYSVGFGTYKGKVLAGYRWNAPLTEQEVLPAKTGTWEEILHRQNSSNKIILSGELLKNPKWDKWTEFRSIGASFDGAAVYSQSIIPRRFNAFIFIDSTSAIRSISYHNSHQ